MIKYFEINEQSARLAHNMKSMREYAENGTTNEYKKAVEEVYNLAQKVAKKKPKQAERIYKLAERYSKNLANYYNKDSSIGLMCPSVLISGASNFPTRKKERQLEAWDKNYKYYEYISGLKEKIINILYGREIIKSSDEDAIEQLEEKLYDLEKHQEFMKEINAYYKKHNTLDNCHILTDVQKKEIEKNIEICWSKKPFAPFELTNNNSKIKNTKKRIERLKEVKETGTQKTKTNFFEIVENTELMRLQLLFEGKPSEEERKILKRNGFRWAPSQCAWQRQLTNNAKYALKNVLKSFKDMMKVEFKPLED